MENDPNTSNFFLKNKIILFFSISLVLISKLYMYPQTNIIWILILLELIWWLVVCGRGAVAFYRWYSEEKITFWPKYSKGAWTLCLSSRLLTSMVRAELISLLPNVHRILNVYLQDESTNVNCCRQGNDREPNFLFDWGSLYLLVHHRILPQACRFVFVFLLVFVFVFVSTICCRRPGEAEILKGSSKYCRHPGNPTILSLLGIYRRGEEKFLGVHHFSRKVSSQWKFYVFNISEGKSLLTGSSHIFNIPPGKSLPTGSDRAADRERNDNANVTPGRGGNQLWRNVQNHSSELCHQQASVPFQRHLIFKLSKVFRIARIMRIFKLARSSTGLQVFLALQVLFGRLAFRDF